MPSTCPCVAAFLDELESVRRHVSAEDGTGKLLPTLVHCSAGVGRTGVLILVELVKACLQHNHVCLHCLVVSSHTAHTSATQPLIHVNS